MKKTYLSRKYVLKAYLWILGIGLAYLLFIRLTSLSIPCVMYELTGIQCAGCGVTRMFVAASKLDFVSAFAYNPCMFILTIIWNIVGICGLIGRPKFLINLKFLEILMYISVGGLMLFGTVRAFLEVLDMLIK